MCTDSVERGTEREREKERGRIDYNTNKAVDLNKPWPFYYKKQWKHEKLYKQL